MCGVILCQAQAQRVQSGSGIRWRKGEQVAVSRVLGFFHHTRWDVSTYIGTLGFFTLAFFLFIRLLPAISMNEVRTLIPQAKVEREEAHVE